jgi:hypothetical protein
MKKLIDYTFYRWYNIYKSKDNNPNIYAAGMVTVYELFTIVNIISKDQIRTTFGFPS